MRMTWDKWKEIIYDAYGIACTVAFLCHFALIAYYGRFYIQEPNPFWFWLEVFGFVGFLILGIERFLNDKREL